MRTTRHTGFAFLFAVLLLLTSCTAAPTVDEQSAATTEPVSGNTITVTQGIAYLSVDDTSMEQIGLSAPLSEAQMAATSVNSRAEVQLTSGTLIRLGEHTQVRFFDLSENGRFTLLQGTVWVILSNGAMVVETDLGTASVTGSYLGVTYDTDNQTLTATCLEGTCELSNDIGNTPLTTGQASSINSVDAAPEAAREMTVEEVDAWVEANPDAAEVAGRQAPGPNADTTVSTDSTSLEDRYSDVEWVDYYFENNCSDSYQDGYEWEWTFESQFAGGSNPVTGIISVWVASGTISTGRIPRVDYATITSTPGRWIRAMFGASAQSWNNVRADELQPYHIVLCPNQPSLDSTAPGYPTPTTEPVTSIANQPVPYYFGNNCFHGVPDSRNHTNWHWSFTAMDDPNGTPASGVSTEIIIPPGEARTGELLGGYYQIRDWTEDGSVEHDTYQDNPTSFYVNLCPDEDPLPGAPAGAPTASTTQAAVQTTPSGQPLTYNISFGCSIYGYTGVHYLFIGPETAQIDVGLGETESGSLPAGQYLIYEWYDVGNTTSYAPSWNFDTSRLNTIIFDSCNH
jgi:hypothetical protein